MSKLARDHRNSDLVKIHIAKKQLNLSDEEYRAILQGQGGASSSKDLDHPGRQRVLDYFKFLGFKPAAAKQTKRPSRPTPAPEKIKLVRRIRAQLISLNRLPDTYADGIAHQMFGLEFYEWATPDQLHAITAALGVMQRKQGAPSQ
jgi:phage gp16-like protein